MMHAQKGHSSRSGSGNNRMSDRYMRFAALLGSTHDAVVAIDRTGSILFWNTAAETMFGHTEADALGVNIDMIIPEEYVQAHHKGLARVAGGGEKHVIGNTVELAAKCKDGTIIPVELSLSTWDLDGEIYFGGIIRDITQRRQQESAIRASEQRLRSLTETASDAIITANHAGEIVSWNAAAEAIFGYPEKEALGQPLEIIIPNKYREGHRAGIARVAGGGEKHVIGHTAELEGLHKNGNVFPIELSLSSWMTEDGMQFCGIIRDITVRKQHETEMQKSREKLAKKTEKLKKANVEIREKTNQLQGLSQKLAKYLSHQVYNSIFEGERDVKIESYRKKLTVFFSDIQGFTELSDRVEAEVLTHLLNSYLNEMSTIANECGGTIDKFIGDAMMIFFGDPKSNGEKEDALACVRMALEMRERLKSLQRKWASMGIQHPLQVRMGINTGYCTVGNFGSEDRMDYTIVGSEVNLANRLETLAETNEILISEKTYQLIKDEIACSSGQEVRVKGFSQPIRTYHVIGYRSDEIALHSLQRKIQGFTIELDPAILEQDKRAAVKEILEQAINLIED